MLTNVISASICPVILVPAMHTEMWLNPSTVHNIATLKTRGIYVVEPENGKLTSGDTGVGRYPEVSSILSELQIAINRQSDLLGKRVLVSAGGTREAIDPVRYIGNHSSGKQGIAVAIDAVKRGATVTLVLANQPDFNIEGITTVHVSTALELQVAMEASFDSSDIVVMSAAVADARPKSVSSHKIATENYQNIELIENPDIIAELSSRKKNQFVIGFAAQTSPNAVEIAKNKLSSKKLDLIYVNDVSEGKIFGQDETQGILITKDGDLYPCEAMSKKTLAQKLLNIALDKLG
jgi:phosphopantothenoylcysteine decarboxylase/phosphopantothenate--cysteine ligase